MIRCTRHWIGSRRGLRERDNVTNGLFVGEQHDQTVEAERDATMRRRAKLERMDEVTELLFNLFIGKAAYFQDEPLFLGIVNTDRTATHFKTIHDQVI